MVQTSVVIPSYRRPGDLEQAILSVLDQQGVEQPFEIIVVDNDPAGSAEPIVAALARPGGVPLRYVCEPRPGISHARNTGVAAASGYYLAFLDDDERVEPSWLAAFLATLLRFGADAAVGPVYPSFPAGAAADSFCRGFYTRDARAPTGTPLLRWNIGNSIFIRDRCFAEAEPFEPRLGLSGGEDSVFLRRMTRSGRAMVWCAEAAARETVPADRTEPKYLLRRAFRGGQTTTFVCVAVRPRELGRAVRHMMVGCAQFVLFGPVALILRLANRPRWVAVMAKAAAGLGKLLWHPSLHLHLYRRGLETGRAPALPAAAARVGQGH